MSKKNIIRLNCYDENVKELMFKSFVEALRNGKVRLEGKDVYIELDTLTYVVDSFDFVFMWAPSFKYVFENDLVRLSKKNLKEVNSKLESYTWNDILLNQTQDDDNSSKENEKILKIYQDIEDIEMMYILNLYDWTGPIFDEFADVLIKSGNNFIIKESMFIKYKNDFFELQKELLKSNEMYYQILNSFTIKFINWKDNIEEIKKNILNNGEILKSDSKNERTIYGWKNVEERKETIDRFILLGLLDEKDKIMLHYYETFLPEELEELFNKKDFLQEEKEEICFQVLKKLRENEKNHKSKEVVNRKIVRLMNLLNINKFMDMFSHGLFRKEEVEKSKLTKKDLLELEYDNLVYFLNYSDVLLPDSLKITSKDLINEYGRSRSGEEIFKLVKYGYIEPQDIIELYETNKVLRMTYSDEKIDTSDKDILLFDNQSLKNKLDFIDDGVKEYYSPEILIEIKNNGKLSPKFIQSYIEMNDFENNRELFKEISRKIVLFLKTKEDSFKDEILEFFEIGLLESSIASEYITNDYIEEKFINNEISIEKIFEYYQKGLINEEAITNYYSQSEIFELYKNGDISGKCLTVINNSDLLIDEFINGNIADEDFVNLYFKEKISVENLDYAIQLAEKEINIYNFIDENIPVTKIKELFSNYMIDYSSILQLRDNGIISDLEFEDMKKTVNTKEFFKALNEGKTYKVVTTRKNYTKPNKHNNKRDVVENEKDKFLAEIELISELLEKDVEKEPYALIESYNASGKPTSLNNYRIFGNEKLDGIVVLQKSQKENAVFVMSAIQMMYFLKGKENDNGDIEIQNRMKDKAYLKTIEGVEVVEHTEYFARNLVEAMSRVSSQIKSKVKLEDKTYISEVDKMVQNMREKYLETKAKSRED